MGTTSVILTPTTPPSSVASPTAHTKRTTTWDMIEYLRDFMGADAGGVMDRVAHRAIQAAIRELANAHNWTYFYAWGRVNTNGLQTAGTIQVQVSAGTYPNQVTLTGATWPSWAQYGELRIGTVIYQVERRISDTIITLTANLAPVADLPVLTPYSLYRDTYTLPEDFVSSNQGFAEISWGGMEYVHPSKWLQVNRYYYSFSNTPRYYTFRGDPHVPGRLALSIFPYPDTDKSIDFVYKRRPRAVVIDKYETGKVTVDSVNSPMTITGAGVNWTSNMVGSVIRLSSNLQAPTGFYGSNPAVMERNIRLLVSSTNLGIDDNADQSLTGIVYRISDPIDLEDGAMLEAFFRCCEKQASIMRNMKDKADYSALYEQALVEAKEADSRNTATRAVGSVNYGIRMARMPAGPDIS